MAILSLSPHVLEWAAQKVGLSLEDMGGRVAAPSKRQAFMQGKLTPAQAEQVASIAKVPFGYLFLETPPELERPDLPDLRQLADAEPLSDNFYDVLADVARKQEWFADHLREGEMDGPAFVGKFAASNDPHLVSAIAADISSVLQLDPDNRRGLTSVEGFYSFLAERLEYAGVLVFKSGIVGANTRRPLSPREFRGFAIVDPLAPAIFVNGADWPSAWAFTLVHEAAHIWLGHSGVSNTSPSSLSSPEADVEVICNRVAAEVLTPTAEFLSIWKELDASHFAVLSRYFRVSQLVIARRALDLGLVPKFAYLAAADASRRAAEAVSGGGDGYNNILVRNSKRLTRAVVARALAGDMMLRYAGSLLNASPRSVVELGRRFDANE